MKNTHFLIIISCTLILIPWLTYGTFDPDNRKSTIIHLEHISDHESLVLQKPLDHGALPPSLENEFHHLHQEINAYIKSKNDHITPEEIEQFFSDKGYNITVMNSDDPDYLNKEDYYLDTPREGFTLGGAYAILIGTIVMFVVPSVAAVGGFVILVIGIISTVTGFVLYDIEQEAKELYRSLGGEAQDMLNELIDSTLTVWQEKMGSDELRFLDIFGVSNL